MTHTWLGPNHRRSLWRTSDAGAVCLGNVEQQGDDWVVNVPVWDGEKMGTCRLRTCDDREAAGKTLCAYHRIPMPAFEAGEVGDDL